MKTECLRAAGIWVDSDRVSSLKEFGIILYSGEITGMLGLVGSGITVVADALSGRKKLEKAIGADAAGQMGIAVKELEKSAAEADSREKLMISIYRWILNRCQVIIFHNVLEGADLLMRDGMVEVINLAHKKGLGFLLFSSNKKELYELCDHIYILNRGQIVEELRK